MGITIKETSDVKQGDLIAIYKANKLSSAEKPEQLFKALINSHSFVTAWHNERLVGIGNAISDGHLVVLLPSLTCSPRLSRQGHWKTNFKQAARKVWRFSPTNIGSRQQGNCLL